MAIGGQIVVESRRYSGWIDPRYPIGYWQAALSLTGNATGGFLTIDLLFQPAFPAFLNSQMYSVERFSIREDAGIDPLIVRLGAVNMSGPANLAFSHEYAITMGRITGVSDSVVRADQFGMLPWFLGSQRVPGLSASLTMLTANSDGTVFKLEAEGYRWSARSVLVDGGPQRPPTGPYGR